MIVIKGWKLMLLLIVAYLIGAGVMYASVNLRYSCIPWEKIK